MSTGWGFFLCTQKDVRQGRSGDLFISLGLQDKTGQIRGTDLQRCQPAPRRVRCGRVRQGAGPHRPLQRPGPAHRRAHPPGQSRPGPVAGFARRTASSAPRARSRRCGASCRRWWRRSAIPFVRDLLERVVGDNATRLRVSAGRANRPSRLSRGGFSEHILAVALVALPLAEAYGANADIVMAGAILHDIGKLQELDSPRRYDRLLSRGESGGAYRTGPGHGPGGNLRHRRVSRAAPARRLSILIVSHHGQKAFGSRRSSR